MTAPLRMTASHTLVCYDIAHPRRLRRVARLCERFGDRVQESVFFLHLEAEDLQRLLAALARTIDPREDSVRYIPVCREDLRASRGLGLRSGLSSTPSHWVV